LKFEVTDSIDAALGGSVMNLVKEPVGVVAVLLLLGPIAVQYGLGKVFSRIARQHAEAVNPGAAADAAAAAAGVVTMPAAAKELAAKEAAAKEAAAGPEEAEGKAAGKTTAGKPEYQQPPPSPLAPVRPITNC
jgi:hypothetical protein